MSGPSPMTPAKLQDALAAHLAVCATCAGAWYGSPPIGVPCASGVALRGALLRASPELVEPAPAPPTG